jgi:hypothetical protein
LQPAFEKLVGNRGSHPIDEFGSHLRISAQHLDGPLLKLSPLLPRLAPLCGQLLTRRILLLLDHLLRKLVDHRKRLSISEHHVEKR